MGAVGPRLLCALVILALASLSVELIGVQAIKRVVPQQGPTSQASASRGIPQIITQYSLLQADPMRMKSIIESGRPLTLPLLGKPASLFVHRNNVVKDGTQVAIDLPDGKVVTNPAVVWTYNGYVDGAAGSTVTLTIAPGYVGGRVNMNGAHLIIEDLAAYTRNPADDSTLILYDVKDVHGGPQAAALLPPPIGHTTSTTQRQAGVAKAPASAAMASNVDPYDYIRPVADSEYFYNWGGGSTCTAWCTHIATVINDITPEYQNQIGATFTVSVFEAQLGYISSSTTQDLSTNQPASNILGLFQQYLWAYTYAWPYDNAILFSGKVFTCCIIGLTEQQGALNSLNAYSVFMAWNEYAKYGTHMEEWVAAHEIGHLFGGGHCAAVSWTDSNGIFHYSNMWPNGINQGKSGYSFDLWFSDGTRTGNLPPPPECSGGTGTPSNVANMQPVANRQLSIPVLITTPFRAPALSVVSYSPAASWVNPNSILGLSDGAYAYVPWNADGGCAQGDVIVLDMGSVYYGGRIWFWYYGYGNADIRFEVSSDQSTWTKVNDVVLPFYSTPQQLKIAAGSYGQAFRYVKITLVYTNCNTVEFDSVEVMQYFPLTVKSYSPTASWVNDLNMVQLDGGYGYVPWNADGGCAQGDSAILDMGNGGGSSYSELTKNGGSIYFWYYGYGNSGLKFEVSNDLSTWTFVNQVNLPFYSTGQYLYDYPAGSTSASFRYVRLTLVYTNCNTQEFDSFLVV